MRNRKREQQQRLIGWKVEFWVYIAAFRRDWVQSLTVGKWHVMWWCKKWLNYDIVWVSEMRISLRGYIYWWNYISFDIDNYCCDRFLRTMQYLFRILPHFNRASLYSLITTRTLITASCKNRTYFNSFSPEIRHYSSLLKPLFPNLIWP